MLPVIENAFINQVLKHVLDRNNGSNILGVIIAALMAGNMDWTKAIAGFKFQDAGAAAASAKLAAAAICSAVRVFCQEKENSVNGGGGNENLSGRRCSRSVLRTTEAGRLYPIRRSAGSCRQSAGATPGLNSPGPGNRQSNRRCLAGSGSGEVRTDPGSLGKRATPAVSVRRPVELDVQRRTRKSRAPRRHHLARIEHAFDNLPEARSAGLRRRRAGVSKVGFFPKIFREFCAGVSPSSGCSAVSRGRKQHDVDGSILAPEGVGLGSYHPCYVR